MKPEKIIYKCKEGKMSNKRVKPKKSVPDGWVRLAPFCFELDKLSKISEECRERKLFSLAMAIEGIFDEIIKQRDQYVWMEKIED